MVSFLNGLIVCTCIVVLAHRCVSEPHQYETVHDQILAANDAVNKRRMAEMAAKPEKENVFQRIENTNEANHLRLYQGDIKLDPELREELNAPRNRKFKRNAMRSRKRLWLSRIIPYYVPPNMRHITSNLNIAINEFHKHTCLRFVPYNGHRNYISFDAKDGCSSRIGKKYFAPGKQTISLAGACTFPGTIIHELMHAIGFFHEQSRMDRDNFVKINFENIRAGFEDQFTKYNWKDIDHLGIDYDYQSIMHYSRTLFTKNGKPTIEAINNPSMKFGNPQNRLSTKDIIEINALYDCRTTRYGWTAWSQYTPCDKQCKKSRERYCYHNGNVKMCGGNVNIYGIERQRVDCVPCPEPIDGHWGHWGSWMPCSATCDEGARKRTRVCNNPTAAHGGKKCPGSNKQAVLCRSIKRCHLDKDDTDFEGNRMGVWSNTKGDDFDWTFQKWFTQTMLTGPKQDHTSGKGYYLYIESSIPRRPGDKARLVTPWLPFVRGGQCIKFAYSMYGRTTGRLSLMIEMKNRNVKYYIFYKKGNQGEGWKSGMGNIDLPPSVQYRLTFEAVIGSGTGYSDIAIDDVYIDPGLCNCQDDYTSCTRWARQGECNKSWMKKHCKRSCKQCVKPTTIQQTPTPVATTAASCSAKDVYPVNCKAWAARGECFKNAAVWMEANCPVSCAMCLCTDGDPIQCPKWASKGQCKTYPQYMLVKCIKSCHVCRCYDNNVSCITWAGRGACKTHPTYMSANCKRSCKKCV